MPDQMVGTDERIGLRDPGLWKFVGKSISERGQETVDGGKDGRSLNLE
jgi:hypothetical protein